MAEYVGIGGTQTVGNRQAVATITSIPCRKGYIVHNNGTGVYTLRGITDGCFARYEILAKANISVPKTGTVGPIAVGISVNGEVWRGSRFIVTPAAVGDNWGAVSPATIDVPRGCCVNVAFEPVPVTDDPATAPAPAIDLQDIIVQIKRVA